MTDTRHDIVCLSSQPWADSMWTNKQHIMSRLAERHRVIYADHGFRSLPGYLFDQIRNEPTNLLRPERLLTEGVYQKDESLWVATSYGPQPAYLLPVDSRLRNYVAYDLKMKFLRRFLDREGIDEPIVWAYHPAFADAVDELPRKLLVYDCVDEYTAFPNYEGVADWIADKERRLCEKADLVFTTSQALYDDKKKHNPEHTHLVHNVGDAEHFKQALDPETPIAEEVAELDGPVIGFVGAVSDYKLNEEWLLELGRAKPDWDIVVIGPIGVADSSTDVSAMEAADNIHLLGYRDYEDLPTYLKGFDVATIPYRINEYTRSVFPIKFFEFLATGTPVVISALPSLTDFYDDVEVANDAAEFVERCEVALEKGDESSERRVELAEQNSWWSRIDEMMGHVEGRLEGRKR
jgi:glycosyltransferase involved in cell wall biosynthesis